MVTDTKQNNMTRRKRPPVRCPHCDSRLADNIVKQKHLNKKIILKDDEGDIVVKCQTCGKNIGITIE